MKALTTLLAAAVCFSGCAVVDHVKGRMSSSGTSAAAGSRTMSVSPAQPAAEGTVAFGVGDNDNTSIALTVKHLASPGRLNPPAYVYVVWTRAAKDAVPQNIGALAVDQNLTGRLSTVSPLHAFELLVSAEPNGQAQKLSGEPILWTSYSR